MTYSLVGVGSRVAVGNGLTVNPSLPAGHTTNDLLLWYGVQHSISTTVTVPSGYSTLFTKIASGSTWLVLAGKIDGGSESAPSTTANGSSEMAQISCFRGGPTTITGIVDNSATTSNTSLSDINTPSLTPATSNTLVIAIGSRRDDYNSFVSNPSGFTTIDNFTSASINHSLMWAYLVQGSAAPISSSSFSINGTGNSPGDGSLISLVGVSQGGGGGGGGTVITSLPPPQRKKYIYYNYYYPR